MKTKTLGRTDIEVPIVGLGGANLGFQNPSDPYDYYIARSQVTVNSTLAIETVHAALEAGVRLVDTAPLYQNGLSETNIAAALRSRPDLAANVMVTTKIGHLYPGDGFNYSYRRAKESFWKSLKRLGRDGIDILYLHDPMGFDMNFIMGHSEIMQALRDLRTGGAIKWIGIAANDPGTAADYIETGQFDVATVSGAWSLINQKAEARIFPAAAQHNVGLVVTTAIERGLLANGPVQMQGMRYLERNFSPACIARVSQIKALCESFGIPLVAAALQWCTRHPQVACTIPGARTPEEARMNTLAGSVEIPDKFWEHLDPLVQHFDSYQEV